MFKKRYFVLGAILGILNLMMLYIQFQNIVTDNLGINQSNALLDILIFILLTGLIGSVIDSIANKWSKSVSKTAKKK